MILVKQKLQGDIYGEYERLVDGNNHLLDFILCENVNNLSRSGKVIELKCIRSDFFTNKMVVNFNVFGASMEHEIVR